MIEPAILVYSIFPIIILIALGHTLKKRNFFNKHTWTDLEKLTYYIFFPCLLVSSISNQSFNFNLWKNLLLVIAVTLLISSFLLISWHRLFKQISSLKFTSVFQGGVRFNTYIALTLAYSLFGAEGLALASSASAIMIIIANLLCVFVFVWWGANKRKSISGLMKNIFLNPLIIACGIGIFLSILDIKLINGLADTIKILGQAALPSGLLIVGAALKLHLINQHINETTLASMVQFIIKPLLIALLVSVFNINSITAAVLFILFIVPTAPSAYTLSRQLGGDSELMATIITIQTLLSFGLIPLLAILFLR